MFLKAFFAAGFILTSLTGVANAYTVSGFPQVDIFSPNAHIDLLPGAFITGASNNVEAGEAFDGRSAAPTPSPQIGAGAQPAPQTPGPSAGSDAASPHTKLVQLPQTLLTQISKGLSSPSQMGPDGGSSSGGSQPGISTVPLPAGLPLFAVALIATAALSRGCNLRFARR